MGFSVDKEFNRPLCFNLGCKGRVIVILKAKHIGSFKS